MLKRCMIFISVIALLICAGNLIAQEGVDKPKQAQKQKQVKKAPKAVASRQKAKAKVGNKAKKPKKSQLRVNKAGRKAGKSKGQRQFSRGRAQMSPKSSKGPLMACRKRNRRMVGQLQMLKQQLRKLRRVSMRQRRPSRRGVRVGIRTRFGSGQRGLRQNRFVQNRRSFRSGGTQRQGLGPWLRTKAGAGGRRRGLRRQRLRAPRGL